MDRGGRRDPPLDGARHPGQDRDLRLRAPDGRREAGLLLGLRPGDDRTHVMRLLAGLLLFAASAAAHAGLSFSADLEGFKWEESSAPSVTEKGGRYGFSWGFLQERDAGWQFAYRGQFRRGTVDYTGSFLF